MRLPPPAFGTIALLATCMVPSVALAQAPVEVTLAATDYHGYNISCFGKQDGAINATVTGGTPPYTFEWTNGADTEDVTDLAAGYYGVKVSDANGDGNKADLTLKEPMALAVQLTPYAYPSGLNISCYECYNGSIAVEVQYGVPPYSYQWGDDPTTQNRTGLGAMTYGVVVTDASGCHTDDKITLQQPERDDWSKSGSANTDPSTQFLGTTDAKDLVLKSNGTERLRLTADGKVSLSGLGEGILVMDDAGYVKSYFSSKPHCFPEDFTPWYLCGNEVPTNPSRFIGSVNEAALRFRTYNVERMRITPDGLVTIGGGAPPTDQLELNTELERGGISLINKRTDGNAHTEIRFKKNENELWSLGCDIDATGGQDFFLWDATANAARLIVDGQGRVGIGTTPPTGGSAVYRLFVDQGIATRDVKVQANGWPDYVFAQDYELLSLTGLREHLSTHQHLPGIPSATELEASGGYEVGDMQARILKVVEEQALYILQLEDRIKALEQRGASNQH